MTAQPCSLRKGSGSSWLFPRWDLQAPGTARELLPQPRSAFTQSEVNWDRLLQMTPVVQMRSESGTARLTQNKSNWNQIKPVPVQSGHQDDDFFNSCRQRGQLSRMPTTLAFAWLDHSLPNLHKNPTQQGCACRIRFPAAGARRGKRKGERSLWMELWVFEDLPCRLPLPLFPFRPYLGHSSRNSAT